MTDQSNHDAAQRRRFLGTGAAAMALGAAIAPGAASAANHRGRLAAAGAYPFTRNRFQMAGPDITLPKPNVVYLCPWTVTEFSDAPDITLQPDGHFLVNTTGLYTISLCMDWPGQHGVDIDLRRYGISRIGTQGARPRDAKGAPILTPIDGHDDRLAEFDSTGVDSPAYGRYTGTWAPGFVPMGGSVSTTISFATLSNIVIGDMCNAALTSISDAAIGAAAVNALVVTAKVVGNDKVRVNIYNPSIAGGVTIPSGTLNVMAASMTLQRGNSADSWNVVTTPLEELLSGQVLYSYFLSKTKSDFIQISDQTFIQFQRWA